MSPVRAVSLEERDIEVGFSASHTLMQVAAPYNTIFLFIRELHQNSIDKNATKILTRIDIKKGKCMHYDNGDGATLDELEERIQNIGQPQKDPDLLGEKGTGLWAPLGISDENGTYRFMSRDMKGNSKPFRLILDKSLVSKDDTDIVVKAKEIDRSEFHLLDGSYNTYVCVTGIYETLLRRLRKTTAQEIADYIGERFGSRLSQRKPMPAIRIEFVSDGDLVESATVKPLAFTGGAKNEPVVINTPHGTITFKLWVYPSPLKKRSIKLLFQHRGHDYPFKNFKEIPKKIMDIWYSGHFQGFVQMEGGEINETRTELKYGDAYNVLIDAVTKYAEEVLQPYITEMKDDDRNERILDALKEAAKSFSDHLNKKQNLIPNNMKETQLEFKKRKGTLAQQLEDLGKNGVSTQNVPAGTKKGPGGPGGGTGKPGNDKPKRRTILATRVKTKAGKRMYQIRVEVPGLPPIRIVDYDEKEGWGWDIKHGKTKENEGTILISQEHPLFRAYETASTNALKVYFMLLLMKLRAMDDSDIHTQYLLNEWFSDFMKPSQPLIDLVR